MQKVFALIQEQNMLNFVIMTAGFTLTAYILIGLFLWMCSLKYSHLPGDLGKPVFGNIKKVLESFIHNSPRDLLERVYKEMDKYGDTVAFWFGPVVNIATCSPEVAEAICNHPAAKDKEYIIFEKVRVFKVCGLFTTSKIDSEEFKFYKKLYWKRMTKKHLDLYHDVFTRRTMELVNVLEEEKVICDINLSVYLMTADVILETQYGLSNNLLRERNFDFGDTVRSYLLSFVSAMTNPMFYMVPSTLVKPSTPRVLDEFHLQCLEAVKEKIKKTEIISVSDDLSLAEDLILNGFKAQKSLEHLDEELRELFYVGSLTVSTIISSALLFLALFQECQEQAWKEQYHLFLNQSQPPKLEDMKRMLYLDSVIKETVRLLTPVITSRRLTDEIQIGDLRFPKNSTIIIALNRMVNKRDHFEDPDKFNPDKWLSENVVSRNCLMSGSFGMYPRICPGGQFGMNFTKVVLSTVVRNFKLSTTRKLEDITYQPSLLLEIEGPFNISFEKRNS